VIGHKATVLSVAYFGLVRIPAAASKSGFMMRATLAT
jgi:hypothetical protein